MTQCKKKPKYIFVLPWRITYKGGVNQVVASLYSEFRSNDQYQPLLLITEWNQSKFRLKKEAGIATGYYGLRSPSNPRNPVKGLLSFLLNGPLRMYVLFRFLKEQKVQVVNAHYPTLDVLSFSLLKYLRLFTGKIVLSFHGSDIANASKAKGMERIYWNLLLRSSDTIVTCSQSLAEVVSTFSPRTKDKIHVIHNGISTRKITDEVDRTGAVEAKLGDHSFILNIGTFDAKKGQDVLIRAFQRVKIEFPDLRLVLIGRSGAAETHLKQLADELGVADNLVIIKDLQHHTVAAFLEKASIFALPSRVESFGIAILEAGIFGVPVIASAVGGVTEILEQEVTAYLLPPEDPLQLAEKIIFLMRNPLEGQRIASNLRSHVLKNFDWDNAYRRYLKIAST